MKDDPCAREWEQHREALVALHVARDKYKEFAAKEVEEGEDYPNAAVKNIGIGKEIRLKIQAAEARYARAKFDLERCREGFER